MRASAIATVAALLTGTAGAAWAQPVRGPYVALGVGANFLEDKDFHDTILAGVPTSEFNGPVRFDTGFVGVASAGWGFGNGLRVEIEGNYRYNDVRSISGAASSGGVEQKYGAMANLFYDFDVGWPVSPYIGIGVGEQTLDWRNGQASVPGTFVRLQHPDIGFAYQAILGAAVKLPVPGLALTAEYRYLGTTGGDTIYGQYFAPGLDRPAEVHAGDESNHSVLIGLRYAFNAAPPPMAAEEPPPAAAEASRTYLVFFDWDRADLTDRARQIIAEAAQATTRVQVTRIAVNGYTDRSGTARYNQGLSERRAHAVAAELVRLGVPRPSITERGFGETNPLVPTAQGVREPQNRRVEIILR